MARALKPSTAEKNKASNAPLVKLFGPDERHASYLAMNLWRTKKPPFMCVVMSDHGHMQHAVDELRFYLPETPVYPFPAWDVQPYDRMSADTVIQAQRMRALSAMQAGERAIVVTTPAALMIKVPSASALPQAIHLHKNGRIDRNALALSLEKFGYLRVGTVMEPGEYAVRGALVDIFPPERENPVRIDFFDDEIESLKEFDAVSQRSESAVESLTVSPASETPATEEALARFRSGFREHFPNAMASSVYEDLSHGRRNGMSGHYLPLFYEEPLQGALTHFPAETQFVLSERTGALLEGREENVRDAYTTRLHLLETEKPGVDHDPYFPLRPEMLYEPAAVIVETLATGRGIQLVSLDEGDAQRSSVEDLSFLHNALSEKKSSLDVAVETLQQALKEKWSVWVSAFSPSTLARLLSALEQHGFGGARAITAFEEAEKAIGRAHALVSPIGWGMSDPENKRLILTEQDLFGEKFTRKRQKKRNDQDAIHHFSELSAGDLVVHIDHGIGRFKELLTMEVDGARQDFIQLEYEGGDKLYVPVLNLNVLTRFSHAEGDTVRLDKLGGAAWQARKAKVKEDLLAMAGELLKVAAARETKRGHRYEKQAGMYDEFAAGFPYVPTPEQQSAIDDVEDDMFSHRAMDRVVVGDVGFGKTEVALRAAFVAASEGRQVALVVPTTLLARQHYLQFKRRFAQFPVQVALLSRMVTGKVRNQTIEGLKKGQVDVVIGTHAILSQSIQFKDLGLVIVDEEHRFGVRHKEKLKQLKENVDVLTLTATPIPRTLQMALGGLRSLSLITSPPVDRLAVRTYVVPFDLKIVRESILREIHRGGQVYVVTPYVDDMPKLIQKLEKLVPEASIRGAHGQMPKNDMEDVMTAFYEGGFNVLVSTTIVESGIDVPNANTLLVHKADRFGIAQLHQLRGRVGRSNMRAYCYLLLPERGGVSETAEKRLKLLQRLDQLGAGFQLASYDLDIRGAGNVLGTQQSGHIREIGFELYNQMLQEAIEEARAKSAGEQAEVVKHWEPTMELGLSFLIPEKYVPDFHARLSVYRRLSRLKNEQEIQDMQDELLDRFGALSEEVSALFDVMRLKVRLKALNIEKLQVGEKGAVIRFYEDTFRKPEALLHYILQNAGLITMKPDQSIVISRAFPKGAARLKSLEALLTVLENL